ncbi:ABC transporter permease subunit [Streptococcus devriesei]|uniref:ABC transporter permease subunit n=1 Tax=Streptococcus devriesei TaxID=231233 RepID=UPI000408EE52|nr:ABC transporter permease subunit [Streptococcus devriesei]
MSYKTIGAILRKDILEVKKDKSLMLTVLLLPMIFSVILPLLLLLLGANEGLTSSIAGMTNFLKNLTQISHPSHLTGTSVILYAIFTYFFLPFFLLIPVMIATTLSSTSFVGEKEHKTLEGLLYSPVSVRELILGKSLASALPALVITIMSALVYFLMINTLGFHYFKSLVLPNLSWVIMLFIMSPLLVLSSIFLIIAGSQYIDSGRSAQSLSMFLVLPIFGLVISQSTGVLLLGIRETLILVIVLIIVVILIFLFLIKTFDFERFILH